MSREAAEPDQGAACIFIMTHFPNMSRHALLGWLLGAATKQVPQEFHGKNPLEWGGPKRFRQHAAALTQKEEAAKSQDVQAVKDLDLEHAAITPPSSLM